MFGTVEIKEVKQAVGRLVRVVRKKRNLTQRAAKCVQKYATKLGIGKKFHGRYAL